MEENKYYLRNQETGELDEVTEEQHNWARMLNMLKPKIKMPHNTGQIIVVGTAGDLDAGGDLKKIFYKPENYNVM